MREFVCCPFFLIPACAVVAGYHLWLQELNMKPKTVARNEVESGFKESASMTQIHVVSPQGKLKDYSQGVK